MAFQNTGLKNNVWLRIYYETRSKIVHRNKLIDAPQFIITVFIAVHRN